MKNYVYEIPNPYFLSDIFVYKEIQGCTCYIKVNYYNRIEEIGVGLFSRMHYESALSKELASEKHKRLFNRIDNFYWSELIERKINKINRINNL